MLIFVLILSHLEVQLPSPQLNCIPFEIRLHFHHALPVKGLNQGLYLYRLQGLGTLLPSICYFRQFNEHLRLAVAK